MGRWMTALPTAALGQETREEANALAKSLQELGNGICALVESRELRQSETIRKALAHGRCTPITSFSVRVSTIGFRTCVAGHVPPCPY